LLYLTLDFRNHKSGRLSSFTSIIRQLSALALVGAMVTMTILPVPASTVAGTASARSSQLMRSARLGMASFRRLLDGTQQGGMPPSARSLPQEHLPVDPPSEQELEAKVSKLEMNPQGEVMLQSGQPLVMAAIPLDADGNIVQGLAARWESDDKRVVFITKDGQARAGREGKAHVTATAGQKKEKVKVTVVKGAGPFGGEKMRGGRIGATGGTDIAGGSAIEAPWSRGALSKILRRDYRGHALGKSFIRAAVMPEIPPDADPLPDDETSSLYTTTNAVGSPPGRVGAETATPPTAIPARERAGSANFTFDVPLVSLPGRAGLDVNLGLTYNSRLWHKSVRTTVDGDGNETQTTRLTYDVDNGWPGTGFKLGYGQMESQGSAGATLTDGDGTRHEMRRVNPSDANNHDYESTDGTFILFNGGRGWGTVTYTDGTRVEYGAAGTGPRSADLGWLCDLRHRI
jgi:Bacterial Ig-like domain (group 2)